MHAKASIHKVAQDFMASMTTMGLSQLITGPTHQEGHTLDLVFCLNQDIHDLKVCVWRVSLTPFAIAWTDQYLVDC